MEEQILAEHLKLILKYQFRYDTINIEIELEEEKWKEEK